MGRRSPPQQQPQRGVQKLQLLPRTDRTPTLYDVHIADTILHRVQEEPRWSSSPMDLGKSRWSWGREASSDARRVRIASHVARTTCSAAMDGSVKRCIAHGLAGLGHDGQMLVCGRGRQRIDQAQGLTGRCQSRQNRWPSEAGDGRPSRLGVSHASDGTLRLGYVAGGGRLSRAPPYRSAVERRCKKRRRKRSRCRWLGVQFGPQGLEECAGAALAEDGRT